MTYVVPVLVAVALWWLSTAVALYRIGLPHSTFRRTFAGVSLIALVGFATFWLTRTQTTTLAAYLSFGAALAIWSWHELSYYLGYVDGPAPHACPDDCSRWQRFVAGVNASLYHELGIVVTAMALVVLSWGSPNQIAAATFCVLWIMRWSAKLNIFLGARNVHMEFLPHHLQYLSSYMTQKSMNVLFPFSVLAALMALALFVSNAMSPGASALMTTGNVLLAALLALALLEHVALMLKVPDAVLWRLATSSRRAGNA